MYFLFLEQLKSTLFSFVFLLIGASVLNGQDINTKLYKLYDEAEKYQDSLNSIGGDTTFSTFFIEERTNHHKTWESIFDKINSINREALQHDDKISYDLFKRDVRRKIIDHEFENYLLPINHEGGFYTRIVGRANSLEIDSVKEYENYLSRLRSIPKYFDINMDLMRKGLSKGHTLPRQILSKDYKGMIRSQIVENPTESGFYIPFEQFPPEISESEQKRLKKQARQVIKRHVIPTYKKFLQFIDEEYIPKARNSIAVSALPGGDEYYSYLVRYYTTLDATPEEIHQIGLDEVKRIRAEMEAIIMEVNFQGTFDKFLEFLRTDPQFYVEEPERLLKEASYIAKQMDGQLPKLFNMLPRQPYGIEPVPAHLAPRYTGGRYSPSRGERDAGNYWVNTYDLDSRPLYTLEALTFHEAVPGHHLQIALAKELDLPEVRKKAGVTAFVEGWALYSERLGLEAGFYQDPYSNFGRLTYEMWRACRLVVDTGMHALGWSRKQAVNFMTENTALSHHEINTEVNRYIAVPGQALAYKMGELKIRELRDRAEQELDNNFDVREFHDAVLLSGPVPLGTLEQNINRYIQETKAK